MRSEIKTKFAEKRGTGLPSRGERSPGEGWHAGPPLENLLKLAADYEFTDNPEYENRLDL